jgi:hypothetical protein
MKTNLVRNLAALATLVAVSLFLGACNGAATPDAAAIATSVVKTVEARYTQQAAQSPTETTVPTTANTSTPIPVATPATSTPQPVDSNGKPCYRAEFVADVTIPDGKLVEPGSIFTKTWSIRNTGNCTWDQTYSLVFDSGDAMGATTSVPLSQVVGPDDPPASLSVDLTAPTTNGEYTGYWRISTPFGGTFGVGINNQSMIVKINVTDKPKRDEGVSGIDIGLYQRVPEQGCNAKGAAYTFSAAITANSAINVTYHWNRYPYDGSKPEGGRLNFAAAGSKTVYFTWNFQKEAIQDIDRSVTLTIDSFTPQTSERIHFTFTCQQ